MKTIVVRSLLLGCALLASSHSLASGTWRLGIENDWVFSTDGNYTNGLFLGYQRGDWGWSIGQKMWTPSSIKFDQPQPNERPFAGLLYSELSYTSDFTLGSLVDSAWRPGASRSSLLVGVVGPESGAESVQHETHRWFPASKPQGWDGQIRSETVFQARFDSKQLLWQSAAAAPRQWEVSTLSRLAVGNYQSEASLGGMLRWGKELATSYSSIGLAPGYQLTLDLPPGSGYYLYAALEGRYRHNDITIDGELPAEIPRVDLAHLQGTGALGIVWYRGDFGASWKFVVDTRDFKQSASSWQGYGALDLLWRF